MCCNSFRPSFRPSSRACTSSGVLSPQKLTRSAVQRLLAEGGVTCGGAPVRKNARTEAGAVYAVTLPEARPVETAAQDIPLDIVYEDELSLIHI